MNYDNINKNTCLMSVRRTNTLVHERYEVLQASGKYSDLKRLNQDLNLHLRFVRVSLTFVISNPSNVET